MSSVRIMVDTTACIPQDLAKRYNIKIIPAADYVINGKKYIENETITTKDAYNYIRQDSVKITTSAVTPGQVLEAYKVLSRDTQDILFITISSKLSAVDKSGITAANLLREQSPQTNVKVIDSKSVAGGAGLPALAAAKAAAQGMNLEQVSTIAQEYLKQTKCLMTMDTLRYIYRIGRMSKMGARITSMLNIRPINQLTDEGTVEMVDRKRSREAVMKRILELVKEKMPDSNLTFMISHGDAPDLAEQLSAKLKQNFKCQDIIVSDYSPIMGYGGGPGAMCIAFHPEINLF
jgi:DegV family protein with EDD domain